MTKPYTTVCEATLGCLTSLRLTATYLHSTVRPTKTISGVFFFFFGYILAKWGSVALGHCTHGYCCTVLCMTMHIIGYLHLPHPSLVSTALDWPMFFCTQPWLPLLSTLCAISLNDHLRFYRL